MLLTHSAGHCPAAIEPFVCPSRLFALLTMETSLVDTGVSSLNQYLQGQQSDLPGNRSFFLKYEFSKLLTSNDGVRKGNGGGWVITGARFGDHYPKAIIKSITVPLHIDYCFRSAQVFITS